MQLNEGKKYLIPQRDNTKFPGNLRSICQIYTAKHRSASLVSFARITSE